MKKKQYSKSLAITAFFTYAAFSAFSVARSNYKYGEQIQPFNSKVAPFPFVQARKWMENMKNALNGEQERVLNSFCSP